MAVAARLAGGLTRAEVLAAGDRLQFVHPVIRDALEASLDSAGKDRAHRRAARLLHADAAPAGQVAAHLLRVRPAGDGWVLARLQEAAEAAMDSGAPQAAAGLLDRALAEPPPPGQRAGVLREAARAQVTAGRRRAFVLLAEALQLAASEPFAVAQAMTMLLAGLPAGQIAALLEQVLQHAGSEAENWDTRAALLWVLVVAERFGTVEESLTPMLDQVRRRGSARGFVAAYSTLGLLRLRLGALDEADAAARVALRVLQEGDFAPGLGFAATVLSDIAVEAGELDEAQALLDLLPQQGWPAGVATVLIPAARGRLRLAQGRAADALADFQACQVLFGADVWGMPTRDTGYVHARSGAALALLRLGDQQRACALADAELADVRVFGAPRALGIALRAAGLARGGQEGLALLGESVAALDGSPALLERARSLAELGAALRRASERAAARDPLARALELTVRCGARPLAARAREELKAAGARPRRPWRTGVDALTPSELRVARLAADGGSNREIAGELYVTVKAVEGHLAHAYAKLGIDGRGQLPRALGRTKD